MSTENLSAIKAVIEKSSAYKNLSELFDEDVYDAISLKTCVERRMTKGAPGEIKKAIEHYKELNK